VHKNQNKKIYITEVKIQTVLFVGFVPMFVPVKEVNMSLEIL